MDDIQIQNPSYAAERKQGDLTFYYLFFFFFQLKLIKRVMTVDFSN